MRSGSIVVLSLVLLVSARAEAGWEMLHLALGNDNALIDISMPDERTACAVGVWQPGGSGSNSEGLIIYTSDGGETWGQTKLEGMLNIPLAVSMVNPDVGYLASMSMINPKVYRTDNGGRTWMEQTLPGSPRGMLSDIFFLDEDTGWTVGGDLVFYTTDGGSTWNASSVPALAGGLQLNGVFFVDATHGYAVGGHPGEEGDEWTDPVPPSSGFILRSDDGGQSWQMLAEDYTGSLFRVWFAGSQKGWAVGGGAAGLILHTSNTGSTWSQQTVPSGSGGPADYVTDVVFMDGQNGYAVGNVGEGNPMVLVTENGGASWSVDTTYEQVFEGLSGMELFAKFSVLISVSFPTRGRGMVCGKNALVVGLKGEGFCQDADEDGHQDVECGGDDCDDSNQYVYPGAEEMCNGMDENCDGVPDDGIDFLRDPKNCGSCGFNCQPAQVCWDGTCVLECPGHLTRCGQECADPATDPRHCGGCDQACEYKNAEGVCQSGACALGDCRDGWIDLDGADANGCEYECVPTGVEECDGADNDCDGQIDEELTGCTAEENGGSPDGGGNGGDAGEQPGGSGGGCSCGASKRSFGFVFILFAGFLAFLRFSRRS